MATTGSKFDTYSSEKQAFLYNMRQFLQAGSELCKSWNQPGFDADEVFGMPVIDAEGAPEHGQPLFPLSFDEWLTHMYAHYFSEEGY